MDKTKLFEMDPEHDSVLHSCEECSVTEYAIARKVEGAEDMVRLILCYKNERDPYTVQYFESVPLPLEVVQSDFPYLSYENIMHRDIDTFGLFGSSEEDLEEFLRECKCEIDRIANGERLYVNISISADPAIMDEVLEYAEEKAVSFCSTDSIDEAGCFNYRFAAHKKVGEIFDFDRIRDMMGKCYVPTQAWGEVLDKEIELAKGFSDRYVLDCVRSRKMTPFLEQLINGEHLSYVLGERFPDGLGVYGLEPHMPDGVLKRALAELVESLPVE